MRNHQQSLIELLLKIDPDSHQGVLDQMIRSDTVGLAHLFVDTAFVITAMQFIQEQYWIQSKEKDTPLNFQGFAKKLFKVELAPILFLHAEIEHSSVEEMEKIKINAIGILALIVKHVKTLAAPENKVFATSAVKLISELVEYEHQIVADKKEKNLLLGYSLDRTFDDLDQIIGIDYKVDRNIQPSQLVQLGEERIFEGSGIGVQSTYSTILLALRYLRISPGAHFVDLGSGFGRVGFLVGLMRPDVIFTGYEIVSERVANVNAAVKNFDLEKNVKFKTQDLGSIDFLIPEAEVYYMFDPFTDKTYSHILTQLSTIATKRKINIITSGKARHVMQELSQRGRWSAPQIFETGNFCLFRSF